MNIQLATGTTITISAYEFYFMLKDEDVDEFYQSCIADNLGIFVENPFSQKMLVGRIEVDEDIEDLE